MKKLLLVSLALSLVIAIAASAHPNKAMTGWVVDEKCGAKAAKAGSEECARKCIEAGSKAVFVTDSDKKVLQIANPEALKEHIGHHVSVQGSVDNGTLHVDNVEMASSDSGAKHEHSEHK